MSIHTRFACKLLAVAVCTAAAGSTAQAASDVRYISITGDNADPCTLAKPCRSLQHAHRVVPAGGEIRILDSGFFGNNATIRKSLTISGNGNTVLLGKTITIDRAGVVVTLRGLTLNGRDTIADGVVITAADAVHIEHCVIHGFAGNGISISAAGVEVFIIDSISRDNGNFGAFIDAGPSSRLAVDNSRFDNNANNGVHFESGHATIRRSTASGNFNGIVALDAAVSRVISTITVENSSSGFYVGDGSTMMVESSAAHGNTYGLAVTNGSLARISNSTFTENGVGVSNGHVVETRENNTVRGNDNNLIGNALMQIGGV